jgi:hypothetical protein
MELLMLVQEKLEEQRRPRRPSQEERLWSACLIANEQVQVGEEEK